MNKRKLRRVTIVALVLVLLCNTLGVQAETGAPAVTVSSYEELVNAIDQASNLDTILIGAVIWIPEGASLGDGSKTVILKSSGGYMEIVENTQSDNQLYRFNIRWSWKRAISTLSKDNSGGKYYRLYF